MNKIIYLFLIISLKTMFITEEIKVINQKCLIQTPVCGINNITYKNPCLCKKAHIQIAYRTACITQPILQPIINECDIDQPVCGFDNITYRNSCLCRRAHIKIAYKTACVSVAVPAYDECDIDIPVCGFDNVTYRNPCLCKRANVQVAYQSECVTHIHNHNHHNHDHHHHEHVDVVDDCDIEQPVCGFDNITYRNPCLCRRAHVQIAYQTACRIIPNPNRNPYDDCRINMPVCGYDNKTYPNPCLCHKAQVQVAYRTACVIRRSYINLENNNTPYFNGTNKQWYDDNYFHQNFNAPVINHNLDHHHHHHGHGLGSGLGTVNVDHGHVHVAPNITTTTLSEVHEPPVMVGSTLD